MKLSAMPASVESSAARGVDLAHPLGDERADQLDHAGREATRRGPPARRRAPGRRRRPRSASAFTGSMTRNTYANSETVLMP